MASEVHPATLYLSQLQAKPENTADQYEQRSNAHNYFLPYFLSPTERCLSPITKEAMLVIISSSIFCRLLKDVYPQ